MLNQDVIRLHHDAAITNLDAWMWRSLPENRDVGVFD
jgi:hypothetical protein